MTFDDCCIEMDGECLHQDFDDIDLYGEKKVETNIETDIKFE